MKIVQLEVDDIKIYRKDLINMFEQSFNISFPGTEAEHGFFEKRIQSLKKYINEDKAIVIGSMINSDLAAFVWFFEKNNNSNKIIHINSFVVHEKYRRKGIGKALWSEIENYANKNGIKDIELLVTKSNIDAVEFYKNRDFYVERFVMKKRLLN